MTGGETIRTPGSEDDLESRPISDTASHGDLTDELIERSVWSDEMSPRPGYRLSKCRS